jgi:hypothetical protein
MRNRISIVVPLLIVAAATFANGQTPSTVINVKVPFNFMVDQKEMPAGDYKFRMRDDGSSSLSTRESGSYQRLKIITRLARMDSNQLAGSRLVFDTVGDKKFLSEVWPSGTEDGYLVYAQKGKHGHDIVKQD